MSTPTPGIVERLLEVVEQQISAWAFAHDVDGSIRNDLVARIRFALSTYHGDKT